MELCIDESKLRELIKQALLEVLEDRKDLIYEMLSEIVENMALAKAIEEGEGTESIGKQEILDILQNEA